MLFEYLDALRIDYNNLSKINFIKRWKIKSSVNHFINRINNIPITSSTYICSFINLMYLTNNEELQTNNFKCVKRYYDNINTASVLYISSDNGLDIEFTINIISGTVNITFKPSDSDSHRNVSINGMILDNDNPLIYNAISIIKYHIINYLNNYKSIYFK